MTVGLSTYDTWQSRTLEKLADDDHNEFTRFSIFPPWILHASSSKSTACKLLSPPIVFILIWIGHLWVDEPAGAANREKAVRRTSQCGSSYGSPCGWPQHMISKDTYTKPAHTEKVIQREGQNFHLNLQPHPSLP